MHLYALFHVNFRRTLAQIQNIEPKQPSIINGGKDLVITYYVYNDPAGLYTINSLNIGLQPLVSESTNTYTINSVAPLLQDGGNTTRTIQFPIPNDVFGGTWGIVFTEIYTVKMSGSQITGKQLIRYNFPALTSIPTATVTKGPITYTSTIQKSTTSIVYTTNSEGKTFASTSTVSEIVQTVVVTPPTDASENTKTATLSGALPTNTSSLCLPWSPAIIISLRSSRPVIGFQSCVAMEYDTFGQSLVYLLLGSLDLHFLQLYHIKQSHSRTPKIPIAVEGFWQVRGSEEEYLPSTTEESEDGVYWDKVMERVETYRGELSQERCVCGLFFNPLHYYIVDHSGFHGATSKLLVDVLPQILNVLPKETHFSVPRLSEEAEYFFDKLIMMLDDVLANTVKEKTLKKLVSRLLDSVTMIKK
ncbi:hypothetical protein G9A89_018107 [Geosiphon pyriformis]|nr:hypothetical protein G9A89_018107 [Geosiphon pyriformis]